MKEKVVFQTNVPMTAALAYPDGMKVEGRYGDQVMYSLTDDRVMYAQRLGSQASREQANLAGPAASGLLVLTFVDR